MSESQNRKSRSRSGSWAARAGNRLSHGVYHVLPSRWSHSTNPCSPDSPRSPQSSWSRRLSNSPRKHGHGLHHVKSMSEIAKGNTDEKRLPTLSPKLGSPTALLGTDSFEGSLRGNTASSPPSLPTSIGNRKPGFNLNPILFPPPLFAQDEKSTNPQSPQLPPFSWESQDPHSKKPLLVDDDYANVFEWHSNPIHRGHQRDLSSTMSSEHSFQDAASPIEVSEATELPMPRRNKGVLRLRLNTDEIQRRILTREDTRKGLEIKKEPSSPVVSPEMTDEQLQAQKKANRTVHVIGPGQIFKQDNSLSRTRGSSHRDYVNRARQAAVDIQRRANAHRALTRSNCSSLTSDSEDDSY
ncbi:hypothetical protein T439DRAFT_373985 [Meredithblackwellia eburnea MCA 4105]